MCAVRGRVATTARPCTLAPVARPEADRSQQGAAHQAWLTTLFAEGTGVATGTLVLRARERLGSVAHLLAWLSAYQRTLDQELHTLVQAKFAHFLELQVRRWLACVYGR